MEKEDFMLLAIQDAKENKHHFGAVVARGNNVIAKAGKRLLVMQDTMLKQQPF